jgi:hypothetical protein
MRCERTILPPVGSQITVLPPHLSPHFSVHTTRQAETFTDEWAMDDAGPVGQGLWLDKLRGRVQHLSQTVPETNGQDRLRDLIERLESHMA